MQGAEEGVVITQFTGGETCTAVINLTDENGETCIGPVCVGYYNNADEVWIEQEGKRVQVGGGWIEKLAAEIKRARKRAKGEGG